MARELQQTIYRVEVNGQESKGVMALVKSKGDFKNLFVDSLMSLQKVRQIENIQDDVCNVIFNHLKDVTGIEKVELFYEQVEEYNFKLSPDNPNRSTLGSFGFDVDYEFLSVGHSENSILKFSDKI